MRAALVALALVVGLVGCGGGGANAEKARYIARADAICKSARTRAAPLVDRLAKAAGVAGLPSSADARRLAGAAGTLHALGATTLARLRALEQPSGDRSDIEAFLDSTGQVVEALGRAATAMKAGDVTSTLAILQKSQSVAADASSAAKAYGFKECGLLFSG